MMIRMGIGARMCRASIGLVAVKLANPKSRIWRRRFNDGWEFYDGSRDVPGGERGKKRLEGGP